MTTYLILLSAMAIALVPLILALVLNRSERNQDSH